MPASVRRMADPVRSNNDKRSSFSNEMMCLLSVGWDMLSMRAVSVMFSLLASSTNSLKALISKADSPPVITTEVNDVFFDL